MDLFLELSIMIFRDIKMRTGSWSAKGIELGQTAQMYRLAWLYDTGGFQFQQGVKVALPPTKFPINLKAELTLYLLNSLNGLVQLPFLELSIIITEDIRSGFGVGQPLV